MKPLILFSLMFIVQYLCAQEMQQYNGAYELGPYQGTAKYSYYEDEKSHERILNGSFKFNATKDDYVYGEKSKHVIEVVGNFINGNAEGLWKSHTNITVKDEILSLNYEINFNNAFPNGSFNYSERGTKAGKTTMTTTLNANFTNGMMTGPVLYEVWDNSNLLNDYGNLNGEKAVGNFDKNGFLDGAWVFSFYKGKVKHKRTANYKEGYLVKMIEINDQTGSIVSQQDNSEKYNPFNLCMDEKTGVCVNDRTYLQGAGELNFLTGKITDLTEQFQFFAFMGAQLNNHIFKVKGTHFYKTQTFEQQIKKLPNHIAIDGNGELIVLGKFTEAGKKTGNWKTYYNKNWEETLFIPEASYYREANYRYSDYDYTIHIEDVKDYFISGKLQFTGNLISVNPDVIEGHAIWYYENGKIAKECDYSKGIPNNNYKKYFENGQLEEDGAFGKSNSECFGERINRWKNYNEKGELLTTITYKCGKEISRK